MSLIKMPSHIFQLYSLDKVDCDIVKKVHQYAICQHIYIYLFLPALLMLTKPIVKYLIPSPIKSNINPKINGIVNEGKILGDGINKIK